MRAWLIELFGSRQLNQTFWALTLGPLPIWIALVCWPRRALARALAWPWLVPPLLGVAYLVLIWNAWDVGLPRIPEGVAARNTRVFLFHPLIFLVLWAHVQMANLFVGITLLRDARERKMDIPFELALCWLFAPVAVVFYALRVLARLLTFRLHVRRS